MCDYDSENTNEFMKQLRGFAKAKLIGASWQIHLGFPFTQSILYKAYIQFSEKQNFKASIKNA